MVIGIGVVFFFPHDHIIPQTFSLMESYSNYIAEYSALLIRLKNAKQLVGEMFRGIWRL